MSNLLLINGPNLNLLGTREPKLYGGQSLVQIEAQLAQYAATIDSTLACFQSNHEGQLVDRIHAAKADGVQGMVINLGAYTHTSIAVRDALLAVALPFVEVHLSNVYAREEFRHHSYLSNIALGVIVGFGASGYSMAVTALHEHLQNTAGL